MALNYVTLTVDVYDAQGNVPTSGYATFTPSATLTDTTNHEIVAPIPIVVSFKASGPPAVKLLATDNGTLAPSGWGWAVAFTGTGLPSGFNFFLAHADGGSQNLSSLNPVSSVVTMAAYLPIDYPTGAADGYVWTSDADGNGSWQAASGGGGGMTNPMTTLGDIIYENATPAAARLAGNTTSTKKYLTQTGTGSASAAPAWGTIATGDVPTLNQNTSGTAAGLSATLVVGSGGTGQTTQQAALDALAGAVTSGDYLRGNGSHVSMSAIVAADLPTGTTSAQGALQLDGTATDIQAAGVQAAGAKGQAADAKHVHPYQPWQFLPETYGAKGDAVIVIDAAMSSSSNPTHLTCASSTPFTSTGVDGGKTVYVTGAGAAGADLVTTISTVTSSSVAVLADGASTTVSAHGAVFGTDDTAAVNDAVAAAVTYGQAHHNYAEIVFRPVLYMVAGAPTIGGSTAGNAIIPLPAISQTGNYKLTLVFKGLAADAGAMLHWEQASIQAAGPTLICPRLDGTNDDTNGPAAVIGGPFDGYGAQTGADTNNWSNLSVVIDGLTVAVPFNSTYGAFDFYGVAEAYVPNAAAMAMGIVPSGGAWPQLAQLSITNQWTMGLRMPSMNNNDRCDVGFFSCEGLTYGLQASEHTTWQSVRAIYCVVGIQPYSGYVTTGHGISGLYASCEACGISLGVGSADNGHAIPVSIQMLNVEDIGNGIVYDPDGSLCGEIGFTGVGIGAPGYLGASAVTGATGIRLLALQNVPGPVGPPSVPATTVAAQNRYYRDAVVTVVGGNVTVIAVDGTATGMTFGTVIVPSGHTITLTYSSAPTWTWVLL